jgi:hypothetical protein
MLLELWLSLNVYNIINVKIKVLTEKMKVKAEGISRHYDKADAWPLVRGWFLLYQK